MHLKALFLADITRFPLSFSFQISEYNNYNLAVADTKCQSFFTFFSLNLPSSFQSRFGSIVYTIDGRIGEHARKREILVDVPITKNLYVSYTFF